MTCHEDSLLLDAGAGFENYLWSTGDTTQILAVYQSGTYTITVEDELGCTATDSTYVNIINAHIAQNDTTICAGESIELSITGEGFENLIAGFSFVGVFNDHNYYLSDNTASWTQAREVCISNGGHLVSVSSQEENDYIMNFYPGTAIHIGLTDEIIEGDFRWVTNEPLDYTNWSPGEPNNAYNEDYVQLYSNGTWNDEQNDNNRYFLEIEDFNLYSLQWSTGDTAANITVSPTQTTTYYCEITDGINWCTDSVTVYVNEISLNLPDTLLACHQDSLVLDAGEGFENYLWSSGDTTQILSVFQTGTYIVLVEDGFGCTATDSTYVNILNAHIAQNDTTILSGESVELSITGGGVVEGLVAWYPFNGDTEDKSGFGNHGINYGATLTTDRFGNPDNAYYFNGVDNYIQSPFNDSLSSTSLSFWFSYETPITDFPMFFYFGNEENISNWIYYCSLTNNTSADVGLFNRIVTSTTNIYDIYYSTTPPTNVWHHVCCTFDRTENISKVYFNNSLVGQISTGGDFQSFDIVNFGTGKPDNWLVTEWFKGSIDDIRIYNYALEENDIATLFLSDTKNYSYYWSTGDTTATIIVSPTETTTYYCEITDGINWCIDSVTVTVEHPIELEIKAFLEGPYLNNNMPQYLNLLGFIPNDQPFNAAPWNYEGEESATEIPQTVVDWILIELRETDGGVSTATSDKIIATKACFIRNDGNIVDLDGASLVNINADMQGDNLFVVLKHRNHLPVISTHALVESVGIYQYDFTTFAEQTFGAEHSCSEVSTGIWGLSSGNGDGDNEINNLDKNEIWFPAEGNFGYERADFNMDGQVNDSDKEVDWEHNTGKGTKIPD